MRIKNRLIIFSIWVGAAMLAMAACGGDSDHAKTFGPVQNSDRVQTSDGVQTQEASITVQEIVNRGQVDSLHPETQDLAFVDLQLGQSLQAGSLVKSHTNSSARIDISIANFTLVTRTAPETVWRLGSFALNGEAVIELQEGKIFVFDEDNGQENWPLHIETPAGTASARGTWMAVEYNPLLGTVEVECLRGLCELENEHGYQAFTNAQSVVASAVSGPTLPASMKQEGIEAFRALPEVLTGELPIPLLFTPAQAQSKVEDAWAAAVERKALRDEGKSNSEDAPDGQGGNDSSAKGKPINAGSQGSANAQSGKPDDAGQGNGGPNASANGQSGKPDDTGQGNGGPNASSNGQSGKPDDAGQGNGGPNNSANGQSGEPDDAGQGNGGPHNSANGQSGKPDDDDDGGKDGPKSSSAQSEPLRLLGFSKREAAILENQGQTLEILMAIAGVLNLTFADEEGSTERNLGL